VIVKISYYQCFNREGNSGRRLVYRACCWCCKSRFGGRGKPRGIKRFVLP